MAARYPARVWLALVTIYIVWGSTFIALAIVVRDLPPLLSLAIRHLLAGALLLAWALPRGDREGDPVGRAQILAGFVFGGLLFLVGHGTLAWAQQTVPAGVAALLVGSIPIWMALLDRVFFGRRLRSSAYVGFGLGFVGLAFLVDPFGAGQVDRVGALVILVGALAWSAGSLYSRGAALPKRPLVSAGLGAVCGGLLCLVVSVFAGELGQATWTLEAVGALTYLLVVGSLVGFTAYVWLLRVGPGVARLHLRLREPDRRRRARLAPARRDDHPADGRRRRRHPRRRGAHPPRQRRRGRARPRPPAPPRRGARRGRPPSPPPEPHCARRIG